MLTSYRQIFAPTGSLAFSATGFVARLPISMTGIGVVAMLSQLRGSYGVAGAVSAVLALAAAALGPRVSRLVDRYGQRRVARPAMVASTLSGLALLACARFEAPTWALFLFAAGMGVMPNTGSMVRARWAHLYRSAPDRLHTSYSLEAVLDEACFIVGPIMSIGLATSVFPEAGVLLSVLFLAVGVLLFTSQRRTEPPVHPAEHEAGGSAIRAAGLKVLVLTFVATGAVFGSAEVVTVGFAQRQGHTAAASLVLAVWALGSGVAGVVFGTRTFKSSMAGRFLGGLTVMAVGLMPAVVIASLVHGTVALVAMGGALFVAGLSISPTMITAMGLVERLVPAARLNEGMTWTTTGLAVGVALGSSVSGAVVDRAGAAAGYWVPLAAAVFAVLTALIGLPRLRAGVRPAGEPAGLQAKLPV